MKQNDWQKVLKAWRKREGITQTEAAKLCNMSLDGYQKWEYGITKFHRTSPKLMEQILK